MNIHKPLPGEAVLIVDDVRDGAPAKGQTATYEGQFPLTVVLTKDRGETWLGEYDYDAFMNSPLDVLRFPVWNGGEKPGDCFAMVMDNPRFVLPDGSKIWGAECWWKPLSPPTPEEIERYERAKERAKALFSKEGTATS